MTLPGLPVRRAIAVRRPELPAVRSCNTRRRVYIWALAERNLSQSWSAMPFFFVDVALSGCAAARPLLRAIHDERRCGHRVGTRAERVWLFKTVRYTLVARDYFQSTVAKEPLLQSGSARSAFDASSRPARSPLRAHG